jgi:hypothetical protein
MRSVTLTTRTLNSGAMRLRRAAAATTSKVISEPIPQMTASGLTPSSVDAHGHMEAPAWQCRSASSGLRNTAEGCFEPTIKLI